MRLLIASDIHGAAPAMRMLMKRIEEFRPDQILLLGDLLYHGPRNDLPEGYAPKEVFALLNSITVPVVAVRGNCDAEVDQMVLDFPIMESTQTVLDGTRVIAMTHGHLWSEDSLPQELQKADALLSGHTHIKRLENRNGLVMVNPGSTSIPKDGSASYATYENGLFALRSMDGTVLSTLDMGPA